MAENTEGPKIAIAGGILNIKIHEYYIFIDSRLKDRNKIVDIVLSCR